MANQRKPRNQTSDIWTGAAAAVTRIKLEKGQERKKSEKRGATERRSVPR